MIFDPNNPYMRALLETIAGPESGNRANVMYGNRSFTDMSQHPNSPAPIQSGPNAGKTSTAAGKYQFLNSTWQGQAKKLGLPDFSLGSQDTAAADLAGTTYKRVTGRDIMADLADPAQRPQVFNALKGTWTSLPGGIEQGMSGDRANTVYDQNLKVFQQDFGPDNPGFASFLPGKAYSGAGGGENSPREMMAPAAAAAAGGGGMDRMAALMAMQRSSKEGDGIASLLANAAKPRQPQQAPVQVQDMTPAQDYGQMMMQLLPQKTPFNGSAAGLMQRGPYNPADVSLSDLLMKV